MAIAPELERRAEAFMNADPDPETRLELSSLLGRARGGDEAALADLQDRFRGPLEFGTAGLRGVIGAGENRINRAVVIRSTCGLMRYLLESVPDARRRGVVVGRDGRRLSKELMEDAAGVALALGFRVHLIDEPAPTPISGFAVKRIGAACGIVITASHNPPAYNGYKVYWQNAAQIVPPHDRGIAEKISAAPPACEIARMTLEQGGASGLLDDARSMIDRYLEALDGLRFSPEAPIADLSIAYSALHGVGERTFRRAFQRRGFVHVESVKEQAEPNGAFPTVAFPNPEEPGALDLVLALAAEKRSDIVLVNDPDADRLGAAVRRPKDGAYVVLNGNEIGALLTEHILSRDRDQSPDRLVMATIVSSQLVRRMARSRGVRYAETLTGFKWIANGALQLERETGARFVFGYEEALGYCVGGIVNDKDGISAALVLAELAALLKADGRTLLEELERIRRTHGFFKSSQKSVTLPGSEGQERIAMSMRALRDDLPWMIAGHEVSSIWDLSTRRKMHKSGASESIPDWSGDVLVFDLEEGGRISVRPSGTEPKIKFYFEVVESLVPSEPMDAAEARGKKRLEALEEDLLARALLGPPRGD
jgi:phosphomannomutase